MLIPMTVVQDKTAVHIQYSHNESNPWERQYHIFVLKISISNGTFWALSDSLPSIAKATFCSVRLKFIPMHCRAPPPKGNQAIPSCPIASPPSINLSGIKSSGLFQTLESRWIALTSTVILVSFGMKVSSRYMSSTVWRKTSTSKMLHSRRL